MSKKKPKVIRAGDIQYCDGHPGCVYFHDYDDCPACIERDKNEDRMYDLRMKNKLLRKELKLAKLELKEERQLHAGTKLLAAPYLTKHKTVKEHVDQHELLRKQ